MRITNTLCALFFASCCQAAKLRGSTTSGILVEDSSSSSPPFEQQTARRQLQAASAYEDIVRLLRRTFDGNCKTERESLLGRTYIDCKSPAMGSAHLVAEGDFLPAPLSLQLCPRPEIRDKPYPCDSISYSGNAVKQLRDTREFLKILTPPTSLYERLSKLLNDKFLGTCRTLANGSLQCSRSGVEALMTVSKNGGGGKTPISLALYDKSNKITVDLTSSDDDSTFAHVKQWMDMMLGSR